MIQQAALRRSHKLRQGYLSLEPAAPGVLFVLGAFFITMAVMASVPFGLKPALGAHLSAGGPIRERREQVRSSASGSHSHLIVCPICEAGELRALGRESARCESCGCLLHGTTLETLQKIVGLPDALGSHACECGHPEMHRLPDGVFHCPACGSEVLPVETVPPSASPRTSASHTVALSATAEEMRSFSEAKGLDAR